MYNTIVPIHTHKRLYLGIICLMGSSMTTWSTAQPPKKMGIVDFCGYPMDRIFFIYDTCMPGQPSFQKIAAKFKKRGEDIYVFNGTGFDQNKEKAYSYTAQGIDDLLNNKHKNRVIGEEKMNENEYTEAQKAWQEGKIYYVDNDGEVVYDIKANGKASQVNSQNNNNLLNNNDTSKKNQDAPKFHPLYLLLLLPLAFVAWVVLEEKSTQDNPKDKKVAPKPITKGTDAIPAA